MRRFAFALVLLLACPVSAFQGGIDVLATATTVSTAGGANTVVVDNDNHSSAYLVVETTNEVNSASLVITFRSHPFGQARTFCTLTAITTETTTLAIVGSSPDNTGTEITDVCDAPLPGSFEVVFTVSGASASIDVQAELMTLGPGVGSND